MKRITVLLLLLCLASALVAPAAASVPAPVQYMPGVTEEMTEPDFWTRGMAEPDALLATAEEIAQINAAALVTPGTNMHDLKSLSETFDGPARVEALRKSLAADAAYYLGWTWDQTGKKLEQADFDAIIENCADPAATGEMAVRYGVAVERTTLVTFPFDGQILDDPADYDFDYQALVGIRMNEPVAIFTTSADGRFYQVFTSCCSGWVRVEDVAVCADRAEWLSAWDIPAEKRLVFCGDKMYTDYSLTAPETSRRLITMATVLERMDPREPGGLVINRLPLHNYAVYLPVRNEDGSYRKLPAQLNTREKHSEDYLPLTGANLAATALASLGDAYGWGGSLLNEDCSSLNRSIFLCFGLDLPRNGNWQWNLAMPKADAAAMTTEEKLALLDAMPLGTILNFPGHQMMYLGQSDGGYYVVSTVSSIMSPETGKRQRTRDVQINTLEIRRANGKTWIEAVNTMYIPWQYLSEDADDPLPPLPWYHEGTAFCLKHELIDSFDGGFFRPEEAATRAAAVEALWRAFGKPAPDGAAEGFSDLDGEASWADAARWAKARGVVQGVDGAFLPDGALTREQLAVLLWRLSGAAPAADDTLLSGFEDAAEVSYWAREALIWAVGNGLVNGKSASLLAPRDVVTRAEMAVILRRAAAWRNAE